MATVILRPSSTISAGNFNNDSGSGFNQAIIADSDNSTYVFNTAANQSFAVHMDNTSGLSGATFNNFVVTAIFQKHGGRGADGSFEVEIGDASQVRFFELYVTVDYTEAGYGNTVNGVAAANISKVNGVATASIEKVNGV